tara:strand:+ start:145 stop:279 length:135 start_codon:yes stop_codon:yes gene_type:complete
MNYSKARKAMTQDSAYSTSKKRKPTKRKKKPEDKKARKPRSRTY